MDEGFHSRPEEHAQLDDDTDEEDEAGGVHHSSTRKCDDGDVFLAPGREHWRS